MTRHSFAMMMTLAALAPLTGCAGLMMNVKDLDDAQPDVALTPGDSLAIDEATLETSIGEANPKADAKALASQLTEELTEELSAKGVVVEPGSPQTLQIEITRYEKGCGGCRGFFPLFGLGNSYLDGRVTLNTPQGSRVIVVEKTGQSNGMSQMGDQTEKNVGYFATVVAKTLASSDASAPPE